jgi:hypothetical protein
LLIHPFLTPYTTTTTKETNDRAFPTESPMKKIVPTKSNLLLTKDHSNGEEKSEFTFGSGHRDTHSSKSSESFPSELNKFLTKGSGLESSSGNGGGGTESQRTSYEQTLVHRFSEVTVQNHLPSYSPAVPLRIQDRNAIKPIMTPIVNSVQDEEVNK